MDWNIKIASGREKLRIRERKLRALHEMQPDLLPERPYSFFPYMAEDCVLRSDRLAKPLIGQAIRDFLIQEKRAGLGSGPMPMTHMVESMEDGDILMRIRPRFGDTEPDGQLVQLELNAEGKVCRIDRFDENRIPYRAFRTAVSLAPVRVVCEGEKCRYEKNDEETISFSDLLRFWTCGKRSMLPKTITLFAVWSSRQKRNMSVRTRTMEGNWKN